MHQKRNILILTSKTGGGHVSLAAALADRLDAFDVEIIDPQPSFFHWHYRMVSRYALWLWATEFRLSDSPRQALSMHKTFTRFVRKPLRALIQRTSPSLIISTYPFLTYEAMEVLKELGLSIPFAMLPSDANGVHASWLTEKRASLVLAPTQETYAQTLAVGFTAEQTHCVGWPVRKQFSVDYRAEREEILQQLGLEIGRATVFLQGGGEGAASFTQTVERVLALSPDLQVIVAAGTNEALMRRFQDVRQVAVLPFTKEIARPMSVADVVMGKAGPNMLLETVTLGKPFIATAYIPGQEEANLEFIRRHRLGWVALEASQQQTLLRKLLDSSAEISEMNASVQAYAQWNAEANQQIVPLLEGLLP